MTANSEKIIAFLLYPDLALLDMIGPYSVLSNPGSNIENSAVNLRERLAEMDKVLANTPGLLAK